MITNAMSRRFLLAAGGGVLVAGGGCQSRASATSSSHDEQIRRWYALWQNTDWAPVDAMLTDDFTFSSAAGDDHISKSQFQKQCWESQLGLIGSFELEQVFGAGDEALVKYLCRTKKGKSFRNVEYLRFRDDKIASIECYFGEENSFPSGMNKKT
jgi:ketosteroid isomerase-like protein